MENPANDHLKPAAAQAANSQGNSLPTPLRHQLESSFGTDLSQIKVHQSHAPTMLGAQSFSQGNDIFFAPAAYDPFSPQGNQLLMHELTHVVQQGAPTKF